MADGVFLPLRLRQVRRSHGYARNSFLHQIGTSSNGPARESALARPMLHRKGRLMKRALLVGFLALLPVLAACTSAATNRPPGATAPGSGAPQQITVKAMDTMKFDPPTLSAKAGQPIQLTLDNTGQLVHDFAITEGVSQPIKISAQPGQNAVIIFAIDKPGSYTYFCSEPGHEQAGMKGTLTVQ